MRFVWLKDTDGQDIPVNPDQVQHLARPRAGAGLPRTRIIFGAAGQGGLHELAVLGELAEVAELLADPPAAEAPDQLLLAEYGAMRVAQALAPIYGPPKPSKPLKAAKAA